MSGMPGVPGGHLEHAEGEEKQAVRRALSGNMEEFEPLVRACAPRVIRLAYHFLGDWDEARDLAQETFARAYLRLDRYDSGRPFAAWVFTIAAHLATDRLRRRRRQAKASESIRRAASAAAGPLDPLSILSLKEALGSLTPRQRQAVVLCDLHGFSAAEAAAMIGCTGSTVRVLRFLARRRLRDLLGCAGAHGQSAADSLATEVSE